MAVMNRPVPKDNPAPLSAISYGDSVTVGELVYSLDKFRPRFPLRWQAIRLKQGDEFLPVTDDNMQKAVFDSIIYPLYPLVDYVPTGGPGKFGGNLYWWSFAGVLITLHKFKPFNSKDFNYSLLLEFNPNKHMGNPVIRALISRLREIFGEYFCWNNTRMDYTLDVPHPITDIRLLSRKQGSNYLGTYYFGVRGQSGYTRLYDKRKELLEKQHIDIGREVTRIEWESRSGDPVTMDPPFLLGNLGSHEVLRFVPMNDWPAALRTYDPRTAAKIKKNCLRLLPFDPSIYDGLRDRLLGALGLTAAENMDHYDKRQMEQVNAQAQELEKMMASLRKFAQVED